MTNLSIGTWQSLPNESIAEIFAKAGYEWIVIDLEHSCININQAEQLIRVIDLAGSKPFVRLSNQDPDQIKRVLDAGAKGILAPMIETLNQIEKIISACHYPPMGSRGMGLARAQGYGENLQKQDYILDKAAKIEIYAQIESMKGLKNCKEIFSQNINGYFIGPYDLSGSLGVPGQTTHPSVVEASRKVINACADRGKSCGTQIAEATMANAKDLFDLGYTYAILGSDLFVLQKWAESMASLIGSLRER